MDTRISKLPRLLVAALLVMALATTLACSLGTFNLANRSTNIDINLKQDDINGLFKSISISPDSSDHLLLDKVTGVEMHPGTIRILGTVKNSDGVEVNGSYDVNLAAENDQLVVKIVAINLPGIELSDPRISNLNQKIADSLTQSVGDAHGAVLYKDIVISEGVLKMTIQVNLPQK